VKIRSARFWRFCKLSIASAVSQDGLSMLSITFKRFVKRLCTASSLLMSVTWWGDHACVAYSSSRRTYVIYAHRSESRSLETKHLWMRLAREWALAAMLFIWSINCRSLSTVTPRSSTVSWVGIKHSVRVKSAHFLVEIVSCQSLPILCSLQSFKFHDVCH